MKKLSMDALGRPDKDEFAVKPKNSLVLLLDDIRSMHNVGSFFRTADAFAVEKIILCGITAQPPHREIEKTALGATQTVIWEYAEDVYLAAERLKNQGFTIVGVEQTDESVFLQNFTFENEKKFALIFGNEVEGLSDKILPLLDVALEIPQSGTKHSLNVSVAAGIVLWHFEAQRIKMQTK
jgi:tRNA G18 (ribose-2'-O)-methylase SpoU